MTNECCPNIPKCCDMRGYLSFLLLWLVSKKSLSGNQLAEEVGIRKGSKPSPGTIYPALKVLHKNKLIEYEQKGKEKIYSITKEGRVELKCAVHIFSNTFYDLVPLFKDHKKF